MPEARVVIETAPGEEAQIDYGTSVVIGLLIDGDVEVVRGSPPTIRNKVHNTMLLAGGL